MEKKHTKEEIQKIVEDVFETTKPERRVRLITGCKTNGTTDLSLGNICGHPECSSCRRFEKALKEAVKNWSNPIDTPKGKHWIDYEEVKHHQRFNYLLMKGHSSEEAAKIIENEKAGQPDTD